MIELTFGTCSVLIPWLADVELISIIFGMVDPAGPADVTEAVEVRDKGLFCVTEAFLSVAGASPDI